MINSRNKVESRKSTAHRPGIDITESAVDFPYRGFPCMCGAAKPPGDTHPLYANFEFINFACAILREIAARVLRPPVDYTNLLSCSCCNTPLVTAPRNTIFVFLCTRCLAVSRESRSGYGDRSINKRAIAVW